MAHMLARAGLAGAISCGLALGVVGGNYLLQGKDVAERVTRLEERVDRIERAAAGPASIPGMTGEWVGRTLDDEETRRYLREAKTKTGTAAFRHAQQALEGVSRRIEEARRSGRGGPEEFYDDVLALAGHQEPAVRSAVAWLLGWDEKSERFHERLRVLVDDSEPIVRRNAALSLSKFGDGAARPELLAMLRPFEVTSPVSGIVVAVLAAGQPIRQGNEVARVETAGGKVESVRTALNGKVASVAVQEKAAVGAGDGILSLDPNSSHVQQALMALRQVGRPEDLPLIESFTKPEMGEPVVTEASNAAKAIRTREQGQTAPRR